MKLFRNVFFLLLLLSVAHKGFTQSFSVVKDGPVVYKSFGNHIGEVVLVLSPDDKFVLYFESYKDNKDRKLRGKWSKKGKTVRLVFKGKPDFDELFFRKVKSLQIENSRVVRFSTEERGIYIWGVFCMKETPKKPK